jgi:uncharacterized repeat protein (TIGR03803 family)
MNRCLSKALYIGAAVALLAGCGGSQPPIGVSPESSFAELSAHERGSSVSYAMLYSFNGGNADGAGPMAPLRDVNGTFYGTTAAGGGTGCNGSGCGTVFSVTKSGVETVLHIFGNAGDGTDPVVGLTNVHGTLYGTTNSGGAKDDGTVFAITTSGAETVLHSFGESGDGKNPQADLLYVKGLLYGTTEYGGNANDGIVFTITPKGKETVLYRFQNRPDAQDPSARFLNVNGTLYSTTEIGGAYDFGTVFTITPLGTESVLYSFRGRPDGTYPASPLIDVNGTLYGTTHRGGQRKGGTVFRLTASGTETVIHSFSVKNKPYDGTNPAAGLINVKGTLYGTTQYGGANGYGAVFSITASGKETILHSFAGMPGDGANAEAGLIDVNGTLYGTTQSGGTNNLGTVFSITP